MSELLVVGGAGYTGSHRVQQLLRAGRGVVVADNFSTYVPTYWGHPLAGP